MRLANLNKLGGMTDMAYHINAEECIACGTCAEGCPVECISDEGEYYKINAEECIDCGACAAACPVECISPEE